MKKRLVILTMLVCLSATTILGGCGSSSSEKEDTKTEDSAEAESTDDTAADSTEEADSTEADVEIVDKTVEDEGIDAFVKVGEYKGLELTKTITPVTDEEVESEIETRLTDAAEEVTDGTVENGNIANIDYVGKIDGVEFDGGSSTDFDSTIGSNQFIEGFEEGLIGTKTGETKDLSLKFPDDYYNEDYAGKDVVFTVTVNSIKSVPTLSDEWVQANSDVTTVDEYKAAVRQELETTAEETSESDLQTSAWQTVVASSEILQYPKDMVDKAADDYKSQVEVYANYYGMELADYLTAQGTTEEELDAQCQEYGKTVAFQQLILKKILGNEGYTTDDEEYQTVLNELIETSGYTSLEELTENATAESIEETVMLRRVLTLIIDNATVTETTESEAEDAAAAAEDASAEEGDAPAGADGSEEQLTDAIDEAE